MMTRARCDRTKATRRKFLLAAGATGAATIAMPQVSRAQTTVLKVQGSWGVQDILNDFAKDYVAKINDMSGARLKIDYPQRRRRGEAVLGAGRRPFRRTRRRAYGAGLLVRQASRGIAV